MVQPDGGTPRNHVVAGVDGSPGSRAAFVHALLTAARQGCGVEAVTTYPAPMPGAGGAMLADPERLYAETLARAAAVIDEVRRDPELADDPAIAAVPVEILVSEGPAGAVLVERSRGAGLLVVGSRGHGAVRSALLGSVALHCVTAAECPVLVVPAGQPRPPAEHPAVVVGVDGAPNSRAALVTALEEAERLRAPVEVVAAFDRSGEGTELDAQPVVSTGDLRAAVEAGARAMFTGVRDELAAAGRPVTVAVRPVAVEGPAAEVLVARSHDAALLVLGSGGRGGVRGLLVGSVVLRCLPSAACPVLVVHPGPGQARGTERLRSAAEPARG